ncbi:hypothetical protein PBY51_019586 [Eleginops maclovinus]|uniref:Uncharacterized protein n=1 Tax=Eleginops maclovinus TaxID=56733 RepID=A0AAN8AYT5_ELEMC|nr:hypothetical protein PBY51_019586 [Eleginops maclovinus]
MSISLMKRYQQKPHQNHH